MDETISLSPIETLGIESGVCIAGRRGMEKLSSFLHMSIEIMVLNNLYCVSVSEVTNLRFPGR